MGKYLSLQWNRARELDKLEYYRHVFMTDNLPGYTPHKRLLTDNLTQLARKQRHSEGLQPFRASSR
jgi:hypothetical protein